jgi:predicted dehydrogenase
MSNTTLRLAVIGCGGIAQAYLQALRQVPELELTSAIDVYRPRAEAAIGDSGARTFDSVEAMLAEAPCDAALVLTPPNTHEALSIRLLQAGVHVLCEKPLTTSTQSAMRMLQAAAASRRLLMMGSKFRYTPDMVKAHDLLAQGLIGDPLLFENVFCARVDMTRRWNSVRSISGGGVLLDNGCHAVDIARYLLGPIEHVQAQFAKPVQPLEVEDTARLLFESQGGTMGSVDLSWSLHKEVPSYVRIYGAKGTLEIGWKVSRYKLDGDRDWTVFGHGYDKIGAFRAQLANFAAAIRGREAPLINEVDALASVQVIEAAYRSAQAPKWHELG